MAESGHDSYLPWVTQDDLDQADLELLSPEAAGAYWTEFSETNPDLARLVGAEAFIANKVNGTANSDELINRTKMAIDAQARIFRAIDLAIARRERAARPSDDVDDDAIQQPAGDFARDRSDARRSAA